MAQQRYSFDGFTPSRQPSEVRFSLATTSTSDSARNQLGKMNNKAMFTAESYRISFPRLYGSDASGMLQAMAGKSEIDFHYWSPYYGTWRTSRFYVANIDSTTVYIREGHECMDGLSFQITGINPL